MKHPGTHPIPPIHFDTFGTVQHVLQSIDRMVPLIFKGEDLSFIPTLKTTIRMHAMQHKWDVVVLSLSKGMAREELDIILNHVQDHHGPMVIDATASTPAHDVVYNENLLLARKERIIRLNQETGDIMVVLYGVDGLDAPMEYKLMMRRMHYMGVTLDLLLERGEEVEAGATEEAYVGALKNALWHIRSMYSFEKFSEHEHTGERISATAFAALSSLIMAYEATDADYLKERINVIVEQFKEIPDLFKEMGVTYDPYIKAANDLQRTEPAEAKLAATLEDRPEIADLLENNPSSIDRLHNNPGALNEVLNNTIAMGQLENTPNAPLLVNNPTIKEKVTLEHKRHLYEQMIPKPIPD